MAQTGIIWGAVNGHLAIGMNVRWDDIGAATTTSHVYVDVYVRSTYAFSDNQRITFTHSFSGYWDYNLSTPNGTTDRLIGTLDLGNQTTSYSGGPTWNMGARISGAWDGSAPSFLYTFTLPARPASAPGAPGLTISGVTSDKARATLSAPATNGSAIVEYSIQLSNVSNFSSILQTRSSNGDFTGLTAATTYYARARARNGVGWGPYSATRTFTTGATVPGAPVLSAATSITATTASLPFSTPANGGSAITGYRVQISTNSGFTALIFDSSAVDDSPFGATGLTPGQRYWVRVAAINAVGQSAWSNVVNFTTLTGTPKIISPTGGSTVTNGIASATVEALGINATSTITVEWSKSSTFASGIKTVNLAPGGPTGNNRYSVTSTSQKLDNGTWYVRAKVTNTSPAYTTDWSPTVSYTQSHTPSATLLSPGVGAVVKYEASTVFQWRFNDAAHPNDVQSAYELVIENNATGETVFSSGKTALATTSGNTTVQRAVAIDAAQKGIQLRWRVRVWDSHDQVSNWTGYSLFTLSDPPVVTITEPEPSLPVDNGAPTFKWSVSIPSGGTQASATVQVEDVATSALAWQASVTGAVFQATPSTVVLSNGKTYTATITVTDTNGLVGQTSANFTTSYIAPEPIPYSIDGGDADEFGYNAINWSMAGPDPLFVSWKVYRKRYTDSEWSLLATIPNQNVREYKDYMLVAGETYMYSVTQVAMRSGAALESPVGIYLDGTIEHSEDRVFGADLNFYWIIVPDKPELSVMLKGVTSDANTLQFEKASYTLVGRGRHVDYGDELGYSGTLTVQVRQPSRTSSLRTAVENLRRARETCYLRTPFGRLFQVAIGDIGWTPLAGTGIMEMGDLSIPYEEVA